MQFVEMSTRGMGGTRPEPGEKPDRTLDTNTESASVGTTDRRKPPRGSSDKKQKTYYDQGASLRSFQEGDWVLVRAFLFPRQATREWNTRQSSKGYMSIT